MNSSASRIRTISATGISTPEEAVDVGRVEVDLLRLGLAGVDVAVDRARLCRRRPRPAARRPAPAP